MFARDTIGLTLHKNGQHSWLSCLLTAERAWRLLSVGHPAWSYVQSDFDIPRSLCRTRRLNLISWIAFDSSGAKAATWSMIWSKTSSGKRQIILDRGPKVCLLILLLLKFTVQVVEKWALKCIDEGKNQVSKNAIDCYERTLWEQAKIVKSKVKRLREKSVDGARSHQERL